MYDQRIVTPPDDSVMHSLTSAQYNIAGTGRQRLELVEGRFLERLLLLPEHAGAYTWDLVDSVEFQLGQGYSPYELTTDNFRAFNRRVYGGEDIPIDGLYVMDFRQAGPRDVVPLGGPESAPDPTLFLDIPSGKTVDGTTKATLVLEQLQEVGGVARRR